jgi:N-acetylneuraminic acid mutarotase
MGAAELNGRLYVAGGLVFRAGTDVVSAAVYAFDPAGQRWTAVAPMPTPRWRLRLVNAGGLLYAIGGLGADGRTLSTVERYDPRTNTWSTVRPMREARAVPGVTVAGGRIVVVGGIRFEPATQLLRTTEVFDPRTGGWLVVATLLPHGRASLVCAVEADGTVLAIGGATDATTPPSATAAVDALRLG